MGYVFDAQLQIEEKFTPLIMEFLRELYECEPENVRSLCLEYDFKIRNVTFDLKADMIIARTQNFFVETESVKGRKKGWLYNQKTDWILYLDTENLDLYMLDLKRLQCAEPEIKKWRYYEVEQQNNAYWTCGHLVPIHVLSRILGIQKIDLKPLRKIMSLEHHS